MPAKSPEVIYRYQPMRPDAVDLVRNGRLWFSNPSRFNDPFDFLPAFSNEARQLVDKDREEAYWTNTSFRGSRISFMKNTEDERNRRVRDYCRWRQSEFIKVLARKFFVACFSEIPDSILMWSHYASYHSGLCIGIRPAKMGLPREKALRWKVRYLDERLPLDHSRPNDIPLRKARAWRYEREWRVVMATSDLTPGNRPLSPEHKKHPSEPGYFLQLRWDAFESVRFGPKVDPKKRAAVLKHLQASERRHVEIIQMHLSPDRFELEAEVLRKGL